VTDYDNANRTEAVPSRLLVLVAAPWVPVRSIFVIIFASALDARPRYGKVAAMPPNQSDSRGIVPVRTCGRL